MTPGDWVKVTPLLSEDEKVTPHYPILYLGFNGDFHYFWVNKRYGVNNCIGVSATYFEFEVINDWHHSFF